MRIACIYLPSFPLQAYLRQAPARIGAAVAVAGPRDSGRGAGAGAVIACSRAAWAQGVRPRMNVAAARLLAPDLIVVAADAERERATAIAAAETLLVECDAVDPGERVRNSCGSGWALYVQVPARTRGASFGARVLKALERQGLRARVGVADDRFTAWVAAAFGGRVRGEQIWTHSLAPSTRESTGDADPGTLVTAVPHGGSAAFLAPLPLSLLPIPEEVLGMLTALKVKTLGEFAALPPPSVSRPWAVDIDFQALARGGDGAVLRRFDADGPLVERIELDPVCERAGEHAVAGLRLLAHRIAQRLAGRGRAASRLVMRVSLEGAEGHEMTSELEVAELIGHASADEVALLAVLMRAKSPLLPSASRAAIEVAVIDDAEPEDHEDDLFSHAGAAASTASLDHAIARVEAITTGAGAVPMVRALPVEHAPHRRTAAAGPQSRRRRRDARPAQVRLFG